MTLTITHIKVPDATTNTTDGNEHLYAIGYDPPRYPVPMVCDGFQEMPFIPKLWVMAKGGRQERKVRGWFLALHFDKRNHYHG